MQVQREETGTQGQLYVVATPIGNLSDMTPRAIEVLNQVDLIAAEDTRHSKKLLNHFAIATPLRAYHDHNEESQSAQLIDKLLTGLDLALITDAGTPLVSDPGYRLVRYAQDAGIKVVTVPGAAALIAALSVAGLPSDRFAFEGFLPAKSAARQAQLEALVNETRTLIFYESSHRILDCIQAMLQVFGAEREVVIARELTKTFETVKRAPLAELVEWLEQDSNQQKGEFVILVAGADDKPEGMSNDDLRVLTILLEELPVKQAAALAAKITGQPKNLLYKEALELKDA